MIAKKHAQSYMPNGEVSLEQVIQAAIDEAAQSAAVPEHIRSIKIPTDAMEQEFQKHYRRGYEAGKGDAVPVVGEVDKMAESISGMVMEWVTAASVHNGDWQSGLARIIRKRIERFQPTTSITTAELDALRRDAERYRWLRMKGAHSDAVDKVHMLGPQLDAAIDAAIAGENK